MNIERQAENQTVFQGISPKPSSPPDWLYLLYHSSDYGGWGCQEEEPKRSKKRDRGGKRYE